MPSAFNYVSLLIDVDQKWWEPHRLVLRAPAKHEPRRSRVIFHETVHYWQQLGQGFLVRLAQEEWERLIAYERKGERLGPGQFRHEFVRKDERFGFSAQELYESLARFWDVHVIGPHLLLDAELKEGNRLFSVEFRNTFQQLKQAGALSRQEGAWYSDVAFDLAMYGAAGNYAAPYKLLRDAFDSFTTAALFPLLGHFAFQTLKPAYFFGRFVEELATSIEQAPLGGEIENAWDEMYPSTRTKAIEVVAEEDKVPLLLGVQAIRTGSLNTHPVYGWAFHSLDQVKRLLVGTPTAKSLAKAYSTGTPELLALLALDRALALVGVIENRSLLLEWLAPPCVRFSDGKTWVLGELHRRELVPHIDQQERKLTAEKHQIASECVNTQAQWEAFRRAYRGY